MIDNNSIKSTVASISILQKLDARFNQKLFKNFSKTSCHYKV